MPLLLVIVAALASAAPVAVAAEVVVVLSQEAVPYRQADETMSAILAQKGHTTRTVLQREFGGDGGPRGLMSGADVVVAIGTPAAMALHAFGDADVPVVYCMVSDPDRAGLTQGRPIAGVSTTVPLAEQIELLREAVPGAERIGVLLRSDDAGHRHLEEALGAAMPRGVEPVVLDVGRYDSVAQAIDALFGARIDAVWTFPDSSLYTGATVRTLLLASVRNRVPVFGFSPQFVKAGALVGIGIDPREQGRQAAEIVVAALAGRDRPGGTAMASPDAQPPRYKIVLNEIVARVLGCALSPSLVSRADQVFRQE